MITGRFRFDGGRTEEFGDDFRDALDLLPFESGFAREEFSRRLGAEKVLVYVKDEGRGGRGSEERRRDPLGGSAKIGVSHVVL